MLTVGILDANSRTNAAYKGVVASVIGQWIAWEAGRQGVDLVPPSEADVVLLCYAGSVDWRGECRKALKREKIEPETAARGRRPYVITGGPVDAVPLTALGKADGLIVGEGYRLLRAVLEMVASGCDVVDIATLFERDEHAIEWSQVCLLERDHQRPWLLADRVEPLATPDPFVDWGVPPVKSDDRVVRVIGSKGCHFKCSYCATTYRQDYSTNPDARGVQRMVRRLSRSGERVQLISNDPANIPYYTKISQKLDSGSYTIEEFMSAENRAAILRQRPRIVRFGVEGISERLRYAWQKPIPNPTLLDVIRDLQANKINSHMFLIVGAPYEDETDWDKWREFHLELARTIKWGLCRLKFTTFQPSAPSPMMRFVSGTGWFERWRKYRDWIPSHCACRHLVVIDPRGPASNVVDVADQLQITNDDAAKLTASPTTTDLAPSLDDFARMPSNLVRWPISLKGRHRIGNRYVERATSNKALPKIATVRRELKRPGQRHSKTEKAALGIDGTGGDLKSP